MVIESELDENDPLLSRGQRDYETKMADPNRGCLGELSIPVYLCVIAFGASTWINLNGVWVESPLFVYIYQLPEGWDISAYLTVIAQLGLIGPIAFICIQCMFRPTIAKHLDKIIGCLMAFGTFATGLLALFWNKTAVAVGNEHSLALFILFFFISVVDCTSSVTYLPWMEVFKHPYIVAYYVGGGFSGLIPSIIALIQGAGKINCVPLNSTNGSGDGSSGHTEYKQELVLPMFSTSIMIMLLFLALCGSILSYIYLNTSATAKGERIDGVHGCNRVVEHPEEIVINPVAASELFLSSEFPSVNEGGIYDTTKVDRSKLMAPTANFTEFLLLQVFTAWTCALMNGVLPAIASYTSLPYGQTAYHLSTTLSSVVNPIASFLPYLLPIRNIWIFTLFTVLMSATATYLVAAAAQSPTPILFGTTIGSILIVLTSILFRFLAAWIRAAIADKLRTDYDGYKFRPLFWCGAATQSGSFIGAIIMFPIVSIYKVFKSAPSCPT